MTGRSTENGFDSFLERIVDIVIASRVICADEQRKSRWAHPMFRWTCPELGAALFFKGKVLDKQPYGATTTVAESWGTIIKVCSTATDLPIGIAPVISALAASDKIKIVGVKGDDQSSGVRPSDETLKNKTYPIVLPFRFYWDEKTVSDQAKKFVEFCASKGLPSQE